MYLSTFSSLQYWLWVCYRVFSSSCLLNDSQKSLFTIALDIALPSPAQWNCAATSVPNIVTEEKKKIERRKKEKNIIISIHHWIALVQISCLVYIPQKTSLRFLDASQPYSIGLNTNFEATYLNLKYWWTLNLSKVGG